MFVAPSAYPLGGVAVWLDYLTAGLAALDWEPVVGLVSGQWHDVHRYRDAHPGLPTLAIPNPTGSAEGRIRALAHAIEHVRPDVVVGVNIVDVYAAGRRLRVRHPGLRVAMSLHGIVADLLDDLQRETSGLDAVIATNRLACRLCIEHSGMRPERVFYAPYGVDARALATLPRPPASRALRIAWVGRLEEGQKRVNLIAPILTRLDRLGIEYQFRIAGDGPERQVLLQSLRPWIESGRVEFLGALPAGRIGPEVHARADAFLLTSSWETGPIVVWEAMAAGVAVVSSRYIGSGLEAALHHDGNCLLFETGDSEKAALQLARLCDQGLRNGLARAGQRLVTERYSIERSVSAWAASLDSVMKLPAREAGGSPMRPRPAGRLDNMLGVRLGESVRRKLGVRFEHPNPGGEWPHSAASDDDGGALSRKASVLDHAFPNPTDGR